ncbi:MAG: Fe-S protein assembly co-chaperone HscB [Pseudomonadota bacterium]
MTPSRPEIPGPFPAMLDLSKNYFELFGLPVTYVIDGDSLRDRYRELQRALHPDRFASASQQEQRISLQASTRVNGAFETLKDPLRRAEYLLGLHGVDLGSGEETTQDAEFLMEQIELREELAAISTVPGPLEAVQDFMSRIGERMRSMIGQMAVDFETPNRERLAEIRDMVRKIQFFNRLLTEAEAVEAGLEDSFH